MRYRATFEFDADNAAEDWYWKGLLGNIDSGEDLIDWSTFTLEKKGTWTVVPLDNL